MTNDEKRILKLLFCNICILIFKVANEDSEDKIKELCEEIHKNIDNI